jgi:hypothetical protein
MVDDDLVPVTADEGVCCQRNRHDKTLCHEGGHMVVPM